MFQNFLKSIGFDLDKNQEEVDDQEEEKRPNPNHSSSRSMKERNRSSRTQTLDPELDEGARDDLVPSLLMDQAVGKNFSENNDEGEHMGIGNYFSIHRSRQILLQQLDTWEEIKRKRVTDKAKDEQKVNMTIEDLK